MRNAIKRFIPQHLRKLYSSLPFLFRSPKRVFTETYNLNRWNSIESRSGTGSNLDETAILIKCLPKLFSDLAIKSLLDIPCGDFNWMQQVQMDHIDYIGADIVDKLVESNRSRFGGARREFRVLDLTKDCLPEVDLIFCRDCLVHLSFSNIERAIHQMVKSGSKYVMLTTFANIQTNYNIVTGDWRALNLFIPPFEFPPPMFLINEHYDELTGDTRFKKQLGVWKLSDLPSNDYFGIRRP